VRHVGRVDVEHSAIVHALRQHTEQLSERLLTTDVNNNNNNTSASRVLCCRKRAAAHTHTLTAHTHLRGAEGGVTPARVDDRSAAVEALARRASVAQATPEVAAALDSESNRAKDDVLGEQHSAA
jgi:hypothetical protein